MTDRTPLELVALLLAAVVLYLVFSGLMALLSRRARHPTSDVFDLASGKTLSRRRHARLRRRQDRL